MTDNEIIKALECCSREDSDCEECPANGLCNNDDYCLTGKILDLINRQQAEIERLNAVSEICGDCHKKYAEKIERAKSEAIKEFTERLCGGRVSNDPVVIAVKVELKELIDKQRKKDEKK